MRTRHVRFTLNSGHAQSRYQCPLCANSGRIRTRSAKICLDVRFGRSVAVSFCLTKAALSSTTIADK